MLWAWQDADERAKLSHAALTGIDSNNPLESDIPDLDVQTSPLTFVVASDFVRRITVWGKQTDFLIWMQFPGRWNVTDDTHAKLRPKWMKLAQLLDPKASNGSFEVAWIVRAATITTPSLAPHRRPLCSRRTASSTSYHSRTECTSRKTLLPFTPLAKTRSAPLST